MRAWSGWLLVALLLFSGCARVDETEHCVRTRYGKVKEQKVGTGLNWTWMIDDLECFTMTDKNLEPRPMKAPSRDQLTVTFTVGVVYAFDPATIYEAFLDKRSQSAVEFEVQRAIDAGYASAINQWTAEELFGEGRIAILGDSVRAHIQRKLGVLAEIKRVYLSDPVVPEQIEAARIARVQRDLEFTEKQRQAQIDSVQAYGRYVSAEYDAKAKQVTAESYLANPLLLQKEIMAEMARICQGVQVCVLGDQITAALARTLQQR